MKLTGGNLYFQKTSSIKYKYEYLSENKSADVVVVGGGISGALTAYYLAKTGAKVIILEKNIIGYGSTSALAAILEYQLDGNMYKLFKIIGEKASVKSFKLCKNAMDDIEEIVKEIDRYSEVKNAINFERGKAIYFTDKNINKGNMIREFEIRKKVGLDVELVEAHNILNLKCGIALEDGAATMNPYEFTIELFNMLSKMDNVEIYENTEVEEIKSEEDEVELTTNNRFKILANKCILATGTETMKYMKDLSETVYRTFNIVTEPILELNKNDKRFVAINIESPGCYVRFTPDNRIVFGGEAVKFIDSMKNEKVFRKIANCKYKKLFNELQKLFPDIENVIVGYCFNGMFVNTKDNLPIIDELPDMPNVYCNLGSGNNGIVHSIIGGKMLKDILKEYYSKDMHMFKIDR